MKRIISLIILVLYLVPAFGITVSVHYCSGKLADVSVMLPAKGSACACGIPSAEHQPVLKKKCCEQLVFSLKLENQQLKASSITLKSPEINSFKKDRVVFVPVIAPVVSVEQQFDYCPDRPPGRFNEPIYIQNESFLI